MFSGLVYRADCGKKMYYSSTNNYKREQANFFCSSFRKDTDVCSMHYIREKVIYDLVLENMRRVFSFVTAYEKESAMLQLDAFTAQREKELISKKQELEKSKKRIKEIDTLIQNLYEDNAKGKISDDRFATLSISLEAEQKTLKETLPTLEQELNTEINKIDSLQSFIMNVKKVTQPNELTPSLFTNLLKRLLYQHLKK